MKSIKGIYLILILNLVFSINKGIAQEWHHANPSNREVMGINTEKAYNEILKNKKGKKIIVAIIDSGVDIEHEDLKDNIWTNEKEIPENGIDDDNNGYIDDIHGWNFLGNKDGENVDFETLEVTRLYRKYYLKYKNKTENEITPSEKEEFIFYQQVKAAYEHEYEEAKADASNFNKFFDKVTASDELIKSFLQKTSYNLDDLKEIKEESNIELTDAVKMFSTLLVKGYSVDHFKEYKTHFENTFNYHLNLEFDARVSIGDDPENMRDSIYGNNDVIGKTAEHGTHVAGIVAAMRKNDKGIDGIADNALIMSLRVIPDGDERDKDVANAIRYAANNGAQIINMSFGKMFSPNKEDVYKAMKYAESKGVLLVHAAGNNSENIDKVIHYPANFIEKNNPLNTYICVGATSQNFDASLIGNFSNYGRKYVDIFAPGVKIYSLMPNNEYKAQNGTSMACPVVAGVAALLWSYYPDLTATQIKDILLQSGTDLRKIKVNIPGGEPNKKGKFKRVKLGKISVTGKVVNVYEAVKLAEQKTAKK